jgi:hypothetical protein
MSPLKEKQFVVKQSTTSSKKKRTKKVNLEALTQYFIEKDIIPNELNELSEAAKNIKVYTLERTSTPNPFNTCEHCEHDHERVS